MASKTTRNGMTKKDAVRKALEAMGQDAKPAALKPFIKDHFGIEMTPEHITTAKGEILRGKAGKDKMAAAKKPVAPKQPAARPQEPQAAGASQARNGITLQDLQTVKDLVGRVGPDTLRSLIDLLAR